MEGLTRDSLLKIFIYIEGALILGAASWIYFSHIPLASSMQFSLPAIVVGIVVSFFTGAFSIAIGVCTQRYPAVFSELKNMNDEFVAPMVKLLNIADIFLLALLSGFSEEVFFRGAMQSQWGPYAASMMFGLLHDPALKKKTYVLIVCCAGFIFAALYKVTGNLWAPVTAHAMHNLFSLLYAKWYFSRAK